MSIVDGIVLGDARFYELDGVTSMMKFQLILSIVFDCRKVLGRLIWVRDPTSLLSTKDWANTTIAKFGPFTTIEEQEMGPHNLAITFTYYFSSRQP